MIKKIKKEIRVLGVDDSPFKKEEKKCLIVGTVFRGGLFMDGVLSEKVTIDGDDATEILINLIKRTRHFDQLRCIMLKGLSFGGFNVIDIKKVYEATRLPVIVIIRKKPNKKEIKKALKKAIKDERERKKKEEIITKAGKIYSTKIKNKRVYFQVAGIPKEKAEEIIKITATRAVIPEPLRIAHLIAQGIVLGESRGRV